MLVANADTWADLGFAGILDGEEDELVLALLPHPDAARWGGVILGYDGHVDGFFPAGGGPADGGFLFTGFQRVGAGVVASLPPPPCEWATVWDELRRRRRLRGVVVSGTFREAGTPAGYLRLIADLLAGTSWVHADATVAPGAELVASAVGAGCRVQEGARVEASVLSEGAWIGGGAHLAGCVVVGAAVAAGADVRDSLLLPDGAHPLDPASTRLPSCAH